MYIPEHALYTLYGESAGVCVVCVCVRMCVCVCKDLTATLPSTKTGHVCQVPTKPLVE